MRKSKGINNNCCKKQTNGNLEYFKKCVVRILALQTFLNKNFLYMYTECILLHEE